MKIFGIEFKKKFIVAIEPRIDRMSSPWREKYVILYSHYYFLPILIPICRFHNGGMYHWFFYDEIEAEKAAKNLTLEDIRSFEEEFKKDQKEHKIKERKRFEIKIIKEERV